MGRRELSSALPLPTTHQQHEDPRRISSPRQRSREDLTLLRSSSCCSSNSGTAAMATRASSRGPSGCARKEEAGPPPGRLSGAAAAPPPPASLAGRRLEAAGLRHHPSSPGRRPAARHVLPQSGLPRPRGRPSWSRAKKQRGAYPRSAPRGHQHRRAGTGRGVRALSQRGTPREGARAAAGGIYCSARVQDGDRR